MIVEKLGDWGVDAIGFGMSVILQDRRLYDPFAPRPFPRGLPVGEEEWLLFDDAFAAQMVERQRLIAQARPDVIALQCPTTFTKPSVRF